jgi:hypothetical protein
VTTHLYDCGARPDCEMTLKKNVPTLYKVYKRLKEHRATGMGDGVGNRTAREDNGSG